MKRTRTNRKNGTKTTIIVLVVVVLVAFVVSHFFYQLLMIQGDSMAPTLTNHQIVIIDKISGDYKREDIILFRCEGLESNLVKRIVAVEGDEVEIDGSRYILGHDEYYVIGDNLEVSVDSRDSRVGIVTRDDIIGKVL